MDGGSDNGDRRMDGQADRGWADRCSDGRTDDGWLGRRRMDECLDGRADVGGGRILGWTDDRTTDTPLGQGRTRMQGCTRFPSGWVQWVGAVGLEKCRASVFVPALDGIKPEAVAVSVTSGAVYDGDVVAAKGTVIGA